MKHENNEIGEHLREPRSELIRTRPVSPATDVTIRRFSMLRRVLLLAPASLVLGIGLAGFSAPASAQVGIEIGPGGPRLYDDRPYRPVIERRERRVIVEEDAGEDCRVEIRRRVDRYGDVVTRRVRICE
jgi:hypothetical protein